MGVVWLLRLGIVHFKSNDNQGIRESNHEKSRSQYYKQKLDKLKSVAYDIFDDSSWIDNYSCGMVNTEFYVDHKDLNKRIKKHIRGELFF